MTPQSNTLQSPSTFSLASLSNATLDRPTNHLVEILDPPNLVGFRILTEIPVAAPPYSSASLVRGNKNA